MFYYTLLNENAFPFSKIVLSKPWLMIC